MWNEGSINKMVLLTTILVLILSSSLSQKHQTAEAASVPFMPEYTITDCIHLVSDYIDEIGNITEALYLDLITGNCSEETMDRSDDCSFDCKTKLEELKDVLGCCLNHYNDSLTSNRFYLHPLSFELWEMCRVETPGVCNSELPTDDTSYEIPVPDDGTEFPSHEVAAYCKSLQNDAYCLSGSAQLSLDLQLKCENLLSSESLYSQFSMCAKSESGALCGSLSSAFISDTKQIYEQCFEELSSDNIRCSPKCQNFLKEIKRKFDCCVSEDFSRFNESRITFEENLWSRCEVQPPPMKCQDHSLNFSRPNAAGECVVSDLLQQYLSLACTDDGPVQRSINILLKNKTCSEFNFLTVLDFTRQCLVDADGKYCVTRMLKLINATNLEEDLERLQSIVENLSISCQNEIREPMDSCSSLCKNKLEEIQSNLGCCVNFFNQSMSDEFDRGPLSHTLWKLCGVDTPRLCNNMVSIDTMPFQGDHFELEDR